MTGEHVLTHPLTFREAVAEALWAARNLARNCGYAVFPCRLPDKRPCCPRGFKDAARDPEAIERLWRLYPGVLVGVATGEASGIDVLDIDVKHSAARAWWHQHADRVPRTRAYRTLRGGCHLYFRHAPGVRNDQGKKVCEGVDVRGVGGYVIHWFSAGLDCLDNTAPAPWPAWLLQIVRPPPRPVAPPRLLARPYAGPDKGIPAVLRKVATAPEGQRNGLLYWGARRLSERVQAGRISRGDAEAELARAACHAGLPEPEARKTIASAFRAVSS